MRIRKIVFKDYQEIKKLVYRNNNIIPAKNHWVKIWTKNPNFFHNKPSGDVLLDGKKIIGFHSCIYKKSVFKKKEYKTLVSSNWVVDPKYRKYSLLLLSKFFTQDSDIYLTTTANHDVSEIWKSLGAFSIQSKCTEKVLFKVFNPYKFINSYLKLKKIYKFTSIFTFMISFIFKVFNYKKFLFKKSNLIKIEEIKVEDKYINSFNKIFENNLIIPSEKRSESTLMWNLNIIKNNKKI